MSYAYSYPETRLENLLGALVTAIADELAAAVAVAAGQGGQAPAALVQLGEHPGLSVEALRHRLGLTHSAVVRLVDRLAGRGLLERARSGTDGRETLLRLRPAGREAAAAVLSAREQVLREALAGLTPVQREQLGQVLEPVLAVLPYRDADHTSQVCRLCDLAACPLQHCPVEQRYLELSGG
jgi:MarR family transcriptional repressor of emrRAB